MYVYIINVSILLTETTSTLVKKGKNFTPWQKQILEMKFQATHYLKGDERDQLARSLNVSNKRIKNWLKERRRRNKIQRFLCKYVSNIRKLYR